jgi:hypothetical protein
MTSSVATLAAERVPFRGATADSALTKLGAARTLRLTSRGSP